MNIDPNDYRPTELILNLYADPLNKHSQAHQNDLQRYFTYFSTNFYMTHDCREIYQYHGAPGWGLHQSHYLPIEVYNAAILWAKSNFQALPLHEFLSNAFNKDIP